MTVEQLTSDALKVRHALFFDAGADGQHFFPTLEEETEIEKGDLRDDDASFDEDAHFRQAVHQNRFGVDPMINNAFNLSAPGWVPAADAVKDIGLAPPPGFDEGANYPGAFAPGQTPWTDGWTAYPEN